MSRSAGVKLRGVSTVSNQQTIRHPDGIVAPSHWHQALTNQQRNQRTFLNIYIYIHIGNFKTKSYDQHGNQLQYD